MLAGRFDGQNRPLVRLEVSSPAAPNRLPLTFLIDTGAFNTIIMPADAMRFGVPFHNLPPTNDQVIIGGHRIPTYYISVWLDIIDRGSVYSYNIKDARIVDPSVFNIPNPNILGSNAWGRWGLHIEPGKIEIDPLSPDIRTP
jgi:hypothetical protein